MIVMTMMTKNPLRDIKNEFVPYWKDKMRQEIQKLQTPPTLCVIQVGNVEASNRYIRNKLKDCAELGIIADLQNFPEDISEDRLIFEVVNLEMDGLKQYDGILIQLPLPAHININHITKFMKAENDVDGFRKDSPFTPCTPAGIMKYLEFCNIDMRGQHTVVIGRSEIVGKPMAHALLEQDATVTVCHSKTKNLETFTHNCDLIICAVGKPKFLNCYSIHVPVIDVGINFDKDGKICGDCFNTEDRWVTPVPGGVGLMTRCALMQNVIISAEVRQGFKNF